MCILPLGGFTVRQPRELNVVLIIGPVEGDSQVACLASTVCVVYKRERRWFLALPNCERETVNGGLSLCQDIPIASGGFPYIIRSILSI